MTLEWWFAYLLTSIILSLSPGSGAINTMTTSLNHGYRGAVASIAGLQTGLAIHIVLVGVGLGTLFSRSVIAFEVLKWAGAAYLIWLGSQQWRGGVYCWASDRTGDSYCAGWRGVGDAIFPLSDCV
ncbi:hypothetical protein D9I70_20400 [Escherichia coli]|nr:hypothetical protein [Escherichia coli]